MNKLKELRYMRGVSQQVVANLLNVTKATYSRYESGAFEPNQASLIKLANYFNVTIDYIIGREVMETNINQGVKIPVFHQIRFDVSGNIITDSKEYTEIFWPIFDHEEYFAFSMPDYSMEPELHQNDIIIAKRTKKINSDGGLYIVLIGPNNAAVRSIQKEKNGILIIGYNFSIHGSHFYTTDELQKLPVNIIGLVVEIRRRVREK